MTSLIQSSLLSFITRERYPLGTDDDAPSMTVLGQSRWDVWTSQPPASAAAAAP